MCSPLLCGTKFLRVLIFASFAVFGTIRQKQFPQKFAPQQFTHVAKDCFLQLVFYVLQLILSCLLTLKLLERRLNEQSFSAGGFLCHSVCVCQSVYLSVCLYASPNRGHCVPSNIA